jgi:hypothetical protein
MRSIFVIVAPPVLDALAGIGWRQEPRGVQTFCPEAAVKRLDVGVIRHDADRCRRSQLGAKQIALADPGFGAPGARMCGQAVALT